MARPALVMAKPEAMMESAAAGRDEGGVSDAHLLGRFTANGDEAAFELLVRRHQALVLGV